MTQSYEVYGGDQGSEQPGDVPWELQDPAVAGADNGPWLVVLEYANGAEQRPATVIDVGGVQHPSRDVALAAARKSAFEFDPPDPYSPQSRQVFRDGPDGFLVIIEGAMSSWHMSVRVVQHVGDA